MPDLRPLRDDDVVAAHEITVAAFAELDATRGDPEQPQPSPEGAHARIRHLMATDPGGCWAAVDGDDRPIGVALALVREGVWGLSLLVVRPDAQSAGAGGALLHAALGHGRDARGGVILGSSDPRALRAYHRAGFTMHPAAVAAGTPEGVEAHPAVEPFDPVRDPRWRRRSTAPSAAPRTARTSTSSPRAVNCSRSPAAATSPTATARSSCWPPPTRRAARALLRTALARASGKAGVSWLTAAQRWAVDVVVDARLQLELGGAVFLRGDVGRFRPTCRVARTSEPRPLVAVAHGRA